MSEYYTCLYHYRTYASFVECYTLLRRFIHPFTIDTNNKLLQVKIYYYRKSRIFLNCFPSSIYPSSVETAFLLNHIPLTLDYISKPLTYGAANNFGTAHMHNSLNNKSQSANHLNVFKTFDVKKQSAFLCNYSSAIVLSYYLAGIRLD